MSVTHTRLHMAVKVVRLRAGWQSAQGQGQTLLRCGRASDGWMHGDAGWRKRDRGSVCVCAFLCLGEEAGS